LNYKTWFWKENILGNQFPLRPTTQVTLVNMKRHINIGQVSCPGKLLGEKNEVVIREKKG
jgi:hypothetical protein